MAVANEQGHEGTSEDFDERELDVEGASPLPVVAIADAQGADPISTAEQAVVSADTVGASRDEGVDARLTLADAWFAVGAIAPSLEAARQAASLAPTEGRVLERLGRLLSRAGQHREAGVALLALARTGTGSGAWLEAGRALARAEAVDELDRLVDELLTRFPEDGAALRFVVEVTRARPGNNELGARLLDVSSRALKRGDADFAAQCALDAWVESRGAVGLPELVDALDAAKKPQLAAPFAAEMAARALSAGDAAECVRLLDELARAAKAAGLTDEALAVKCAAALVQPSEERRDQVRDALDDAGREVDLSARMRADARRIGEPSQASAAWKGVALLEAALEPGRAAGALAEALARDPGDAEALQQWRGFEAARDAEVSGAAREALWWALREESSARTHATLWRALGDAETRAGDMSGALRAYSQAIATGDTEATTVLESVRAEGEAGFAKANALVEAWEKAPKEEKAKAASALVTLVRATPGALGEASQATRVLAPLAGTDSNAARAWLSVLYRAGETTALTSALRRVATRAQDRDARVRAAWSLAERLDAEGSASEAADVLLQLLDEVPGQPETTAALCALAEHGGEGELAKSALRELARGSWEQARAWLMHVAGQRVESDAGAPSLMGVLAVALDDTAQPRARAAALGTMIEQLGDVPSLLARRTRVLLAMPSEAAEGLSVARTFARHVPLSPEATIAWFGAAGISGDPEQLADAAVAAVHSLASARDAAGVVRAAVGRLASARDFASAGRVAREAAEALGLADRGLRNSLVEFAQRQPDPTVAIELLEAAAAGSSDAPGEQLAALRRIAQLHAQRGEMRGEMHALRRLVVLAPADRDALSRLSALLGRTGDHRPLSRILSLQLASEADPWARREALLKLAALQLAAGERAAAVHTLDRYSEEQPGPRSYAEVARALGALGEYDLAIDRLTRWAERTTEGAQSSALYLAAARLALTSGRDATRVLDLLRTGLSREPESPEALLLAEEVATEAKATREMLAIYDDLDDAAAGDHGRRALSYRRASFLEKVGEYEPALEIFTAIFSQRPVSGALATAIERLSMTANKPQVLVAMHRKLAETAHTPDGQIREYLAASLVAREAMHDRRMALELVLLAHDVKRDEPTARQAVEVARSLKSLDAQVFKTAVETVVDRTLEVAAEVWDDDQKRDLSRRALEIAAVEINDLARSARAAGLWVDATEDKAVARRDVNALLVKLDTPAVVRDAVKAVPQMREPGAKPGTPSGQMAAAAAAVPAAATPHSPTAPGMSAVSPAQQAREQAQALAASGDRKGALACARAGLAKEDDEKLWDLALSVSRELNDAEAELSLLDYRLERQLDPRSRVSLTLRASELLRETLARPQEARRRLEAALAADRDNDELVRALHEVAEQLGAWDAVSTLLARRIARCTDRVDARVLRLHRAAVLEQRLDDVEGARAELEAVLRDEPDHRATLRYLADLHVRAGRFAEAGACLARAASTAAGSNDASELYAAAGEAFARAGNDGEAAGAFGKALQQEAGSARARDGLVGVARRAASADVFERAAIPLAEATEDRAVRFVLRRAAGRLAHALGDRERARAHAAQLRSMPDAGVLDPSDAAWMSEVQAPVVEAPKPAHPETRSVIDLRSLADEVEQKSAAPRSAAVSATPENKEIPERATLLLGATESAVATKEPPKPAPSATAEPAAEPPKSAVGATPADTTAKAAEGEEELGNRATVLAPPTTGFTPTGIAPAGASAAAESDDEDAEITIDASELEIEADFDDEDEDEDREDPTRSAGAIPPPKPLSQPAPALAPAAPAAAPVSQPAPPPAAQPAPQYVSQYVSPLPSPADSTAPRRVSTSTMTAMPGIPGGGTSATRAGSEPSRSIAIAAAAFAGAIRGEEQPRPQPPPPPPVPEGPSRTASTQFAVRRDSQLINLRALAASIGADPATLMAPAATAPTMPASMGAAIAAASPAPPPPARTTVDDGAEAPIPPEIEVLDEAALRDRAGKSDDAARALAWRLARSKVTREEAAFIQRERFIGDPARLGALEALVGLTGSLGNPEAASAMCTVLDVLRGGEAAVEPPPVHSMPEPPPDTVARMLVPAEYALVNELTELLWAALSPTYRREITSYGVTGVDRVAPAGPTDVARLLVSAGRMLQLPRTGLFVRGEVSGGALAARTNPPAVILAAPLASDSPAARYVLGHAIEGTRSSNMIASALDAEERSNLLRALHASFGAVKNMTAAPTAVSSLAKQLFMVLPPRTGKRVGEIIATLANAGTPLDEALVVRAAEFARARAGLLVCGDFSIAARMVVARYTGGGEPDVPLARKTLEPLRDLARFAVSEGYLLLRWGVVTGIRRR